MRCRHFTQPVNVKTGGRASKDRRSFPGGGCEPEGVHGQRCLLENGIVQQKGSACGARSRVAPPEVVAQVYRMWREAGIVGVNLNAVGLAGAVAMSRG